MRITIKVKQPAAQALQEHLGNLSSKAATPSDISPLLNAVKMHGGKLEAVHPGQSHPLLSPFFAAEIATAESAQSLISDLKGLEIVQSAFLAPAPQLP